MERRASPADVFLERKQAGRSPDRRKRALRKAPLLDFQISQTAVIDRRYRAVNDATFVLRTAA